MPRSSKECCTGRALHPLLDQSSQSPEVHNTLFRAEFTPVKPSAGSSTSWFHLLFSSPSPNTLLLIIMILISVPQMFLAPVHPILPCQGSERILEVSLSAACGKPCRSSWRSLERSRTALCLPSQGTWHRDAHLLLLLNAQIPAASGVVLGNAKRDLLLSAFIRDNTRSDQLLCDSTHLMQSFKQPVIVLHWLLFFKLKVAGKCNVNTEQTQGLSGSAGGMLS